MNGNKNIAALPSFRKKEIIEQFYQVIVEDGLEKASLVKIAERLAVSPSLLIHHFKNKDELLNEIVIEGLKIFEGYLRPAFEAGTPYERLVQMTDNYLRFALEQPKYFDFAFLVPNPTLNPMADEIARPDWDTFRLAIEQVAACTEAGIFPAEDPLETAVTIWAELHGLITLYRTGRFGQDPELFREVYRQSVDRMLRGLKALTE